MDQYTKIAKEYGLGHCVGNERGALFVGPMPDAEEYKHAVMNIEMRRHPPIRVMGKECHPKRYTEFYSDDSVGYKYSGQTASALPLTIEKGDCATRDDRNDRKRRRKIGKLMARINEMFDDQYNGVLVNRYITDAENTDYIGAHSDDESNLGTGGVVGVVYGITRKFRIRDKETKKIVCDADVPDGSIVWMCGEFQKDYTHEVPVEKRRHGMRTSATFRFHKN